MWMMTSNDVKEVKGEDRIRLSDTAKAKYTKT